MPRYFSIKPSLAMRGRKFKGIRGLSGKPFHPPLTDIPVAAYIIVALTDLVSYIAWNQGRHDLADDFFVTGTHVIIIGAVVSIFTIATGFWDWLRSTPPRTQAWRTANWHMAVMLFVTFLVVVNIVRRLTFWGAATNLPDLTMTILSVAIGLFVTYGAIYGGAMVYEFGFNVEQDFDHAYEESEHDHIPGQEVAIQEGEPGSTT